MIFPTAALAAVAWGEPQTACERARATNTVNYSHDLPLAQGIHVNMEE